MLTRKKLLYQVTLNFQNVPPFILYPLYAAPFRSPARALLMVAMGSDSSCMPWEMYMVSEVTNKEINKGEYNGRTSSSGQLQSLLSCELHGASFVF